MKKVILLILVILTFGFSSQCRKKLPNAKFLGYVAKLQMEDNSTTYFGVYKIGSECFLTDIESNVSWGMSWVPCSIKEKTSSSSTMLKDNQQSTLDSIDNLIDGIF